MEQWTTKPVDGTELTITSIVPDRTNESLLVSFDVLAACVAQIERYTFSPNFVNMVKRRLPRKEKKRIKKQMQRYVDRWTVPSNNRISLRRIRSKGRIGYSLCANIASQTGIL